MYLARKRKGESVEYILRQSYYDKERQIYSYHQVFNLGLDPSVYIHQLTEKVVYFDEELESAVERYTSSDPTIELEGLLWDFLPPEQRQLIRDFGRPNIPPFSPLSPEEQAQVEKHIHMFDRRRMYYIRYGGVDQSRIFRIKEKIYRPLLFKCRDEKETYIRELESSLPAHDLKEYIFVIFNLQRHFSETYAAHMPSALDSGKMDELFLEEICRLNGDMNFWQGDLEQSFLREHLQYYLIRYFDSEFSRSTFGGDFFRRFREQHRQFRWPEKKQPVTTEESRELFGHDWDDLKKMNKEELSRLFRKRAKMFHPDQGGDAEKFIKLLESYEVLSHLSKKPKKQK